MTKNKVVIGTRASKLALWQAEWVKSELERMNPGLQVELNKIKTTGDKILDVPLAMVGGKGLFVKEIEEAMLRGEADLAVHSMKDVPTEFPEGLELAAICKREDPRDAFITAAKSTLRGFKDLPQGASVGTSSLRRACQLLSLRPDIRIMQLRGNLETRLRKLDEGQFDAIILAVAGVRRLGWSDRITEILPADLSLPAIGQGAIGIECRMNDDFIHKLIAPLNHKESATCVRAERALLKRLQGGCQVPIAAYARLISQESGVRGQGLEDKKQRLTTDKDCSLFTVYYSLFMDSLVGSISGDRIIRDHAEGRPEDAEVIGTMLAESLLLKGADKILAELYGQH
ncbi:MAG: hydroxymethylbilane synthase [Nitrospira bacterium HGW-Nitrospira-1]|nr:MAG: hydroxymethylbilane synthase [Nitrospira bacterium HGW-Nitrospira-1]